MIKLFFQILIFSFGLSIAGLAVAQDRCFVRMEISEMRPAFSDELTDFRGGFRYAGGHSYIEGDPGAAAIGTADRSFTLRTAKNDGPSFNLSFGSIQSQSRQVTSEYFQWISGDVETFGPNFDGQRLIVPEGENILPWNENRVFEELHLLAIRHASVQRARRVAEQRLTTSIDAAVRALDEISSDTIGAFEEIAITVFDGREVPIDFYVGLLEVKNSVFDLQTQESLLVDRGARMLGEYLLSLQICASECLVSFLDRGVVGKVSLPGETIALISSDPKRWLVPLSEVSDVIAEQAPQPVEFWLFREVDPTVHRVAEGPLPSQEYLREDYERSIEEGYHIGLDFKGEVVGEDFIVVEVSDFERFWSILRNPNLPRVPFPISIQGQQLSEILVPYAVLENTEDPICTAN